MSETSTALPGGRVIVDPRGLVHEEPVTHPDRLSSLEGKTVGIVLEGCWRSWYVMTDKLVEILDAKGVRTKPLVTDLYVRLDVNEFGFERVDGHNPDVVDAFAPGMDAAIVGLGN